MSTDNNDIDSEDEKRPGGLRRAMSALLVVILALGLTAGSMALIKGCQHMRGESSGPDRVYAAFAGDVGRRPVIYILNSLMVNEDDHDPHLDDSLYRIDALDLERGERVSRVVTGEDRSRWLGSNGLIAWLVSRDSTVGLYAFNLTTKERVAATPDIIRKNGSLLPSRLDSACFDARSGGAAIRLADGRYLLIDPTSFAARAVDSASLTLLAPADTTFPTHATAHLSEGTELRFNKVNHRIMRSGPAMPEAAIGGPFTRGGFLHDIAGDAPIEPAGRGSWIVLHFASDDEDDPYILTAFAPDGRALWTKSADDLDSEPALRAAHRFGDNIVLVSDEEVIYLNAASGAVARRVEL